jgi:hypothetical protein
MSASDVTAVVLTIGEPFVTRALASLARQTLPPADVVVVVGISPFHRALNAGVERVRSPFLVHVDADMVLDPSALADLRACMAPHIGVAIGGLRDALRGSIVGVKLFRTECVVAQPFPDSIAPDVDCITALRARGWLTAHALAYRPGPRALWHTFGAHEPDYTPQYTFAKFRILGARYRHSRNGRGLRRLFDALHASRHEAALFAQVGAASGVFWRATHDLLQPHGRCDELDRLQRLLARQANAEPPPPALAAAPRDAYLDHYRGGCELAAHGAGATLHAWVTSLAAQPTFAAWSALLGLCRGALADEPDVDAASADFDSLAELFPEGGAA